MRPRDAPNAIRTAISFWREEARASRRLAIVEEASRNSSSATADKISSGSSRVSRTYDTPDAAGASTKRCRRYSGLLLTGNSVGNVACIANCDMAASRFPASWSVKPGRTRAKTVSQYRMAFGNADSCPSDRAPRPREYRRPPRARP